MVKRRTPADILSEYFAAIGRKGGFARAKAKSKAELSASARRAVLARWAKVKAKKKQTEE